MNKDYLKHIVKKALRKTEKYTQTDMVYLAKGGSWIFAYQLTNTFSVFLLAILFANFIDPTTYGNYKYILSIIGLLILFTLPGINISTLRSASRGFEGTINVAMREKIKYGLLGSLISLLIAIYYHLQGNSIFGATFLITAFFLPILETAQLPFLLLAARKEFNIKSSFLKNGITLATTILMILLIITTKNLFFLILGYLFINTFTRLIGAYYINQKYKPNKRIDKESINYGKKLTGLNFLSSIAGNLNSILMFKIFGNYELALYSIAIAPTEQIRGMLRNLEILLLPKMSKDEWKIPNILTFLNKIKYFVITLILIPLTYFLLAPYIFNLIFPKYLDAIRYSQYYIFSLPISGINILLNNILLSKQKTKYQYIINNVNFLTNFLISLPMLYFLGILGFITGILISKTIETLFLFYFIFSLKKDKHLYKNL